MSTLRMKKSVYDDLRSHAEEAYPHECCGVLVGSAGVDGWTVPYPGRTANSRADMAPNRYAIAPDELVKILRDARSRNLEIAGFYHSHPDHPAMWSQTDLAEAHWPGCSYVITSVEKGKAVLTNSFELTGADENDKALVHEKIEVI